MKKVKDAVREGYKQTELGEIPVEWEVRKIEDCFDFQNGKAFYVEGYSTEGKKVVDLMNISIDGRFQSVYENQKYISIELFNKYPEYLLNKGDLIIAMSDMSSKLWILGRTAIVPEDNEYVLNQRIGRLSSKKNNIDIRYVNYFTNSDYFLNQLKKLVKGTAQYYVNTGDITNSLIIVPPIKEQKKIADILSTVDEQIVQTEQLIEKTKELKKGLMQKLLTKGIGHKRFKKTEVGVIPEEWEVIPLIDTGEYINGRAFKPFEWKEHGIPIIRIQNLTDPNASFNYYEGDIESKYIVQYGDLLFAWSGSIGLHIWRGNTAYLNQHIYKVIPRQNIDKMYLYYQLSRQIEIFLDLSHGTTMKHITRKNLELVKIALPSYNEQVRIANILSEIDNHLHFYELRKQQLQQLKKGLMQKLLTGKIRVKV